VSGGDGRSRYFEKPKHRRDIGPKLINGDQAKVGGCGCWVTRQRKGSAHALDNRSRSGRS
jgi:hypothetical protein